MAERPVPKRAAERPVRKRAVAVAGAVSAEAPMSAVAVSSAVSAETPMSGVAVSSAVSGEAPKRKGFRVPPPAAPIAEKEAPTQNYALRLTEALEAISSAQGQSTSPLPLGVDQTPRSAGEGAPVAADVRTRTQPSPLDTASPGGRGSWLAALDRLPPIRLPIGPPIPWRLGLPVLAALVVLMAVTSRSSAQADTPGVQLPAQQTYPVQSEAPLFTSAQQAPSTSAQQALSTDARQASSTDARQAPPQAPAARPLGVPESSAPGFDFFDIGIKLVAVLALAYGSLMLLKRAGVGGAATANTSGSPQAMRVVSSLALAPNRTVHAIKVPGGRTLLVGATPNAVNLIADLGELAETETPEAASFFDVLKGKL